MDLNGIEAGRELLMEFEQALAMHRQGRTDDAVRAYQQVSC